MVDHSNNIIEMVDEMSDFCCELLFKILIKYCRLRLGAGYVSLIEKLKEIKQFCDTKDSWPRLYKLTKNHFKKKKKLQMVGAIIACITAIIMGTFSLLFVDFPTIENLKLDTDEFGRKVPRSTKKVSYYLKEMERQAGILRANAISNNFDGKNKKNKQFREHPSFREHQRRQRNLERMSERMMVGQGGGQIFLRAPNGQQFLATPEQAARMGIYDLQRGEQIIESARKIPVIPEHKNRNGNAADKNRNGNIDKKNKKNKKNKNKNDYKDYNYASNSKYPYLTEVEQEEQLMQWKVFPQKEQ